MSEVTPETFQAFLDRRPRFTSPHRRGPHPIVWAPVMSKRWLRQARECPGCGGDGIVSVTYDGHADPCPRCEGRAWVPRYHRGPAPLPPRGQRKPSPGYTALVDSYGQTDREPLSIGRNHATAPGLWWDEGMSFGVYYGATHWLRTRWSAIRYLAGSYVRVEGATRVEVRDPRGGLVCIVFGREGGE